MGGSATADGPPGSLRIHRERIAEFAFFLSSVLALQGSRFLFTVLLAAGIQPAEFSSWALFLTFVGYAPAVLLGVGNGMNRMVPILIGRSEQAEADEAESATWSMVALVVLGSLGLSALLALADFVIWLAPAVLAGSAMTTYQVQQFAMRSRLLFSRASLQQLGWAGITGVACIGLLLSDGSLGSGLWIWTAGVIAAAAIGFALRRPNVMRPSLTRAWQLMTMGFPIMLSGLMGTLFYTADRWVASIRLEPAAAGSYGLASLLASAVFLVPMVIAQQQYPRLAMLFGSGASGEQLRAAARRQSLVAATSSLATAFGVSAFSLLVLPHILPAYDAVAAPVAVLSIGVATLAGATGYGNLLVVLGARWTYLLILTSCFAVAAVLMWLGGALGGGLGLAIGVASGQAILMTSVIIGALTLVARRTR